MDTNIKYIIKQVPEDFKVIEKSNVRILDTGKYIVCALHKRDLNTADAVDQISKKLKVPVKSIGYAGSKDRRAVTSQLISIKGSNRTAANKTAIESFISRIKALNLKNCELEFLGYSDHPISLGDLIGNEFCIVVRNLEQNFELNFDINKNKIQRIVPNYFDEQRFSKSNVKIGLAMLKNDFRTAAEIIIASKNWEGEQIEKYLAENKNNYIGAIKKVIPKKTIMMYVHAVQSLLFNKTVSEYIQMLAQRNNSIRTRKLDYSEGTFLFPDFSASRPLIEEILGVEAPIIGFGTEFSDSGLDKAAQKALREMGFSQRSFILRSMPEISSEGGSRNVFVEPQNLEISPLLDDELNNGKKKVDLRFFLPKGSYATIIVKALFS